MPQHHSRTESTRSERSGSERPARTVTPNGPFGEKGAASVNAGLHIQKQMFEVFEDIGREWFASATSKAELAFKLQHQLAAANSVPDAVSAYQEWLGEWINVFGEDGRRLMSDSQKIMETGVRCFANTSPPGTS